MDASVVISHDILSSRSLTTSFATFIVHVKKAIVDFDTIVASNLSSLRSHHISQRSLMPSAVSVFASAFTLVVLEYLPSSVVD
jgi:hypothetical protein